MTWKGIVWIMLHVMSYWGLWRVSGMARMAKLPGHRVCGANW